MPDINGRYVADNHENAVSSGLVDATEAKKALKIRAKALVERAVMEPDTESAELELVLDEEE